MAELRMYDELRRSLIKRGATLGRGTVNGLLLVPDFLILLTRLSRDGRLPRRHRLMAASALLYIASPVDVVPGWLFGPAGFVDDITVAVFVIRSLVDGLPLSILHEHWSGDPRFLPILQGMVKATDGWLRLGLRHKLYAFARGKLAQI